VCLIYRLSVEVGLVQGWQDRALARAKADFVASAVGHAFQEHGVAILQESALLVVGQLDGFLATPAELEDGAALVLLRA
jgi:hypothetical protein